MFHLLHPNHSFLNFFVHFYVCELVLCFFVLCFVVPSVDGGDCCCLFGWLVLVTNCRLVVRAENVVDKALDDACFSCANFANNEDFVPIFLLHTVVCLLIIVWCLMWVLNCFAICAESSCLLCVLKCAWWTNHCCGRSFSLVRSFFIYAFLSFSFDPKAKIPSRWICPALQKSI